MAYVAGEVPATDLLRHPAYATVRKHCRSAYGIALSGDDLQRAASGADSPFFGLRDLNRLPQIHDFIAKGCWPMPDIPADRRPEEWAALFSRMTHDEGFAVFAPLALRQARGHMGDRSCPMLADYAVIGSPAEMEECLREFRAAFRRLTNPTREQFLAEAGRLIGL